MDSPPFASTYGQPYRHYPSSRGVLPGLVPPQADAPRLLVDWLDQSYAPFDTFHVDPTQWDRRLMRQLAALLSSYGGVWSDADCAFVWEPLLPDLPGSAAAAIEQIVTGWYHDRRLVTAWAHGSNPLYGLVHRWPEWILPEIPEEALSILVTYPGPLVDLAAHIATSRPNAQVYCTTLPYASYETGRVRIAQARKHQPDLPALPVRYADLSPIDLLQLRGAFGRTLDWPANFDVVVCCSPVGRPGTSLRIYRAAVDCVRPGGVLIATLPAQCGTPTGIPIIDRSSDHFDAHFASRPPVAGTACLRGPTRAARADLFVRRGTHLTSLQKPIDPALLTYTWAVNSGQGSSARRRDADLRLAVLELP